MAGQVTHIIHANLVVRDIETSRRFYTEYLGARVVREWAGEEPGLAVALGFDVVPRWHAYLLRWGEGDDSTFPQLDLLQWIDPPSTGSAPLCLNQVGIARLALGVDNIDEIHERLERAGVEFISAPLPVNPATERGRRVKLCCLRDPDGIIVELVGPGNGP
jgi:catechol 2,3-dioxygenase-like lactoylglutathione lyase family enzyme